MRRDMQHLSGHTHGVRTPRVRRPGAASYAMVATLLVGIIAAGTGITLSAANPSAAGLTQMTVPDRAHKGDRLQVAPVTVREASRTIAPATRAPVNFPAAQSQNGRVREGCDPSFSPVASPSLATITGRCVT